jgi:hypothetical protein
MKGKIFAESNNIYQDQAKVLFDFYQSAAEKIVNEEERIEAQIQSLESEKKEIESFLSSFWNRIKLWFSRKLKITRDQVTDLNQRIAEFKKLHDEIFRDYKVSKLGIAYVPIADQIKYDQNSFIVDYTSLVHETEVKLQLPKQNDLLIETISDLEKLSIEAPIVETSVDVEEIETDKYSKSIQHINQHDYFGKLERSLRTISFCMDELDVTAVNLPLVSNESEYLEFLKQHAVNSLPSNAPVINVFDTQKYNEQISKFQELNKLKDSLSRHTKQFEDVLKELMMTMANSVQAISSLKMASADKMILESNKVLFKILKSPYNHYSPVLEASEIERIKNENFNYSDAVMDYMPFQLKESSKLKYNLLEGSWKAEDGSTTNFPFGIHQIHEEIVAPIVQNLMAETRIERLKIYNHIKDQKISYLNKWHQDTEDFYGRNRAESADLINLMRASLRDYIAAFNTLASLKKTEESMENSDGKLESTVVATEENQSDVLAAFELQSKEFQNVQLDFENFMEQLKEDIDFKASEFEHIEYYEASLRDANSRDTARASDEIQDMELRRKPLAAVNPLFAKTSELPPVPSMEEITHEHSALNLPLIAKETLNELEQESMLEELSNDDSESAQAEGIIDENLEEINENDSDENAIDELGEEEEINNEGSLNDPEVEFENEREEDIFDNESEFDLNEENESHPEENDEVEDMGVELNEEEEDQVDEEEEEEDLVDEGEEEDDQVDEVEEEDDQVDEENEDEDLVDEEEEEEDLVDEEEEEDDEDDDDDDDDDEDDDDEDDDDEDDDDPDGGNNSGPGGNNPIDSVKDTFSGFISKAKGLGDVKGKFGF